MSQVDQWAWAVCQSIGMTVIAHTLCPSLRFIWWMYCGLLISFITSKLFTTIINKMLYYSLETLVILCHNCGRNWMELGEKIGRDGNFAPFNVLSSLSVCLRLNVCSTVKIHTIARFSMRLLAEFSNGYSLIVIFRPGHQIFYVSFTLPMVNDNFILLHFFTTTCILPMKRGEKLCTSWYL